MTGPKERAQTAHRLEVQVEQIVGKVAHDRTHRKIVVADCALTAGVTGTRRPNSASQFAQRIAILLLGIDVEKRAGVVNGQVHDVGFMRANDGLGS